jgi:hypothetical protein
MRSELFAAGFTGAHSHSGLALYDAESTILHVNCTAVWQHDVFQRLVSTNAAAAGEPWDGPNYSTSNIPGRGS